MAKTPEFIGLHHIGVFTANMDESIDFYKKLGMEPYQDNTLDNGTRLVFISVGSAVIELIQHADPSPVAQLGDGLINHIAIKVANTDALVENLKAQGIAFETEAVGNMPSLFANGAKNIFLRGPSRERLEFFEEL